MSKLKLIVSLDNFYMIYDKIYLKKYEVDNITTKS